MDDVSTRYMQIVFQTDQGDHLLGRSLAEEFVKIEHLLTVKEDPEGPHALVQMNLRTVEF